MNGFRTKISLSSPKQSRQLMRRGGLALKWAWARYPTSVIALLFMAACATESGDSPPTTTEPVTVAIATTNLADRGFIIQGDAEGDHLGRSVSSAGDVNGDGYADLIVGANHGDDGGSDAGEAYVIWGQADKQYGTLGSDGRWVVDTTALGDAGFIIQGDAEGDEFGYSVSSAGDVNGDGYADLIIGAYEGDDGGGSAGEAYVIWGQADKQYGTMGSDGRRVIDTTALGDAGFIIQGDAGHDSLGISVSSAGDVNGDGYADLIAGAFGGDDGGRWAGEAYVIWGQANKQYGTLGSDGRRVVDITALGDAGFIIQGDAEGDHLGYTVSSAGDVNGDRYDDLIVGAFQGDDGGTNAGEVYVIWGQADKRFGSLSRDGRSVVATTALGDAGFIIRGDRAEDLLGRSVSSAGDINGDGFADLIVGANQGDDGGTSAGEAYVIWGQADKQYGTLGSDGRRVVDTTALGDAGFIIQGDAGYDSLGWSVSAAGDANGDGYADLIVGAVLREVGESNAGAAYVIWGQADKQYGTLGSDGRRVVDPTALGDASFIIQGDALDDQLGYSVSSAGDVNGDGYADLIVGARLGNDGSSDAGEAYVIWGGTHLSGNRLGYDPDSANQPLREFDAANETDDYSFDFSELFVNANGTLSLSYNDTESDGGDATTVGAATWDASMNLLSINRSAIDEHFDIIITATDNNGDLALWRVAVTEKSPIVKAKIPDARVSRSFFLPATDVLVDLATVFGGGDGTLSYVTSLGSISNGKLTISPSSLSDGDNMISVTATDADGDAVIDVFVLTKEGSARIDTTSLGLYGFIIQGDVAGDELGASVSSAGDVNGDGYADLIVGANRGDGGGTDAGEAYVIWGQADKEFGTLGNDGRWVIDTTALGDAGFIIQGDAAGDSFGVLVASAGDVNGDGYADLIVGAYGGDDGGNEAGEAYVIWGQASKAYGTLGSDGRRVVDTAALGDAGFIIRGDTELDFLGRSVSSAGDVNGDGYADIIVGTNQGDDGGASAGEAYVIWGQADKQYGTLDSDRRRVVDTTTLGDAGFIIRGDKGGDGLGISVSSAGDANGDGYADLIVGANRGDDGGTDAGEAYVIWGQADNAYGTLGSNGRQIVDTTALGDAGFIIQGNAAFDHLGISVSAAGDVNGDGYADLIVGAPWGDDGERNAGETYLIWGQADKRYGTLGSDGRRVVDTTVLGDAGFIIQGDVASAQLGIWVSSAGDVNGDGHADLIVGANRSDDGGSTAGVAYVIWGQANKQYGTLDNDRRHVLDIAALGDAGFIIQGDARDDRLGWSVSSAGDVNGDGYADLIVGARNGDDGGHGAGEAYVIWGGPHLSGY